MAPAFFEKNLELQIGSLHLSLVPQAKIALIGYGVLAIALLLMLVAMHRLTKATRLIMVLFWIVYFSVITAVGLYNLNCTVVGKCNTFAWIVAGFVSVTALYMLFAAAAAVYMSIRLK